MGEFLLIPQERLEALEAKIQDLCERLQKGLKVAPRLDEWISEKEAQELLGKKATSLWTLRKTKQIRFSKIGADVFYHKKSIEKLLSNNEG